MNARPDGTARPGNNHHIIGRPVAPRSPHRRIDGPAVLPPYPGVKLLDQMGTNSQGVQVPTAAEVGRHLRRRHRQKPAPARGTAYHGRYTSRPAGCPSPITDHIRSAAGLLGSPGLSAVSQMGRVSSTVVRRRLQPKLGVERAAVLELHKVRFRRV